MSVRDVLSPFTAWKNLFRDPVTIRDPLRDRPGAPRYRGFHQNDLEKCIGCGTCEAICQNAAIDMVPVAGIETRLGDSGLRPRIDYGRCCWCALCVDVCMTQSLSMSNSYTWVDGDPDAFRFTPGLDTHSWDREALGYHRPAGHRLTAAARIPMGELTPKARLDSFAEIVQGYDPEAARQEADRCVSCGLCIATCPTHMAIPDYIAAVRDGDYERGVRLLYETNPFSAVCGRVCTHKCETSCAARHEGDPIAIRWLKRHLLDQVTPERVRAIVGGPGPATGRRIAIVGAGPAGLTAAFDLARLGHGVTVFEAQDQPGGMTRWGIPEYRLPYAAIDRDIDIIRSVGVEIRCNCRVGGDLTLADLRGQYDIVLLALGLHLGRATRIPGSDHPDVRKAVDLLRQATAGVDFGTPRQALVIGGGNVAMDIARTLARLQRRTYGEVRVIITALEDLEHFLADPEEIREAGEEGIQILAARGPREVMIQDGRVTGLKTWRVRAIFDDQGRFAPTYDASDEQCHPAEMLVEAIGQMTDTSLLGDDLTECLAWQRGRLQTDDGGHTSEDWLWATGDMVRGPDVVTAVADGHRVAASIHSALRERETPQMTEGTHDIQLLRGKTSLGEILAVATSFEASARDFYTDLIPKVSKRIRYLVEELATEEQAHHALFRDLAERHDLAEQIQAEVQRTASDSQFSDCIHLPDLGDNPDDQAVLQYAMGREHAAMLHYAELTETAPEGPIRDLFRYLASEETRHKLALEKLYYETIHRSGGV